MAESVNAILKELKSLGDARYKKMMMTNHGVKEPCFGVKIGDLQKIRKRIKKDYQLALDLYATGNYDAMYLAGLIADEGKMTKTDFRRWAKEAYAGSLPGYTVAGTAAESPHGWELGLKWIDAKNAHSNSIGWSTLSHLVSIRDDESLDLKKLKQLLKRVQKEIHNAPDQVRYSMNHFVICVGCGVKDLTEGAMKVAKAIGEVHVDLGNNACEVPLATDYIRKVQKRGTIGNKRKQARC